MAGKNFQILSLSGGGFLGLYTISVIEKMEKDLGHPIARSFDLIAGTSVGAIIALALANEIPASHIRKIFEEEGHKIFSDKNSLKKILIFLSNIFVAKYNSDNLRNAIDLIVGKNQKISNLKHAVIIPAVNLSKCTTKFFKTPHHPDFKKDANLKLTDVAMAACAVPIYFPVAEINRELFVDGGLFMNPPDLAALHEAEFFLKVKSENIKMLSIGTTTSHFTFSHKIGKNLGILKWLSQERLIHAIISSQQKNSDFVINQKLGKNYLRIDYLQSAEDHQKVGLDVATEEAKKMMENFAQNSYREYSKNPFLRKILSHKKSPLIIFS